MRLEECEHGGDPLACPPCNRNPRVGPVEQSDTIPTVPSKFEAPCSGNCGMYVFEGDPIYLIDDQWVCQVCKAAFDE